MRKILQETRSMVIDLWIEGQSYREINSKIGVSTGEISVIINEFRTRNPDIDSLRRLKLETEKCGGGATVADALRGAKFLVGLNDLGVPLDRLPSFLSIIEKYGPENAKGAIDAALKLQELERSTGKSYSQILMSASEASSTFLEKSRQLSKLRTEEKATRESLTDLDALQKLRAKLSQHQIEPADLDRFIDESKTLGDLGFTPRTAEVLGKELAKSGLDPQDASAKVREMIEEYRILENAVLAIEKKNKSLNESYEKTKRELGETESQLKDGHTQLQELDNQILEKQRTVDELDAKIESLPLQYQDRQARLELVYREKKSELESSYAKSAQQMKDEISGLEARKNFLQEEIRVLLGTRSKIMKNLEQIDQQVQKNMPLAVMAGIMQNPNQSNNIPKSYFLDSICVPLAAFEKYIVSHPAEFPPELLESLVRLVDALGNEIRNESRAKATAEAATQ